jgi:hypothetical protein
MKQESSKPIVWRLHLRSAPEAVYHVLTTDEGRQRFWAERSETYGNMVKLTFSNAIQMDCAILAAELPSRFAIEYFGSHVEFRLEPDGAGGTDLTITNTNVPEAEWLDVHSGWLNVLLPLKAAVDFGIDLHNHDPLRTWDKGFADG